MAMKKKNITENNYRHDSFSSGAKSQFWGCPLERLLTVEGFNLYRTEKLSNDVV